MKKDITVLLISILLVLGCEQKGERPAPPKAEVAPPTATTQSQVSPPATTTQKVEPEPQVTPPPSATQKVEGPVTTEQIVPQTGPERPAPPLSPEERERLMLGTEKEAPPAR